MMGHQLTAQSHQGPNSPMQEATPRTHMKQNLGEPKGQSVQETGDSSRPPTVPEKYFPPHKREEKVDSVKGSPNRPVPRHQFNSFTNRVSHPRVYDAGVSYPTGGSGGMCSVPKR